MTTSWDDARRCPADQQAGKEVRRTRIPSGAGEVGGQLVTLECPNNRCEFFDIGWTVQIRPDGTIPDALEKGQREKFFVMQPGSESRRQKVRDVLAEQVELELKGDGEIQSPWR